MGGNQVLSTTEKRGGEKSRGRGKGGLQESKGEDGWICAGDCHSDIVAMTV